MADFKGFPDPRQLTADAKKNVARTMKAVADEWDMHAHEEPSEGTVYMASFMRAASDFVEAAGGS
jgi:hypothetical protein